MLRKSRQHTTSLFRVEVHQKRGDDNATAAHLDARREQRAVERTRQEGVNEKLET